MLPGDTMHYIPYSTAGMKKLYQNGIAREKMVWKSNTEVVSIEKKWYEKVILKWYTEQKVVWKSNTKVVCRIKSGMKMLYQNGIDKKYKGF